MPRIRPNESSRAWRIAMSPLSWRGGAFQMRSRSSSSSTRTVVAPTNSTAKPTMVATIPLPSNHARVFEDCKRGEIGAVGATAASKDGAPGNPDADKLTRAASSALHPQHAGEPERDRRNVGHQHEHHEHDAVERPDPAHHLFHR